MSPWASSSCACCDGTGLNRAITCGLSPACLASPIASRAPAGSPCACRIRAVRARPAASAEVKASCRHSVTPRVAWSRAAVSSFRSYKTWARPTCAGPVRAGWLLSAKAFVPGFESKAQNLTAALADGRLRAVQGVARAV